MKLNTFDKALRGLAFAYAPAQAAKCGDIVTAHWGGWKKPHKVKIYEVGVEIVSLNIPIGRREKLGVSGWMGVQHYYFGNRVKDNGEVVKAGAGYVLPNFTTTDGKYWECIFPTFNRAGLFFKIEALKQGS